MYKFLTTLFSIFILSLIHITSGSITINGSISLHSLIFDKVIKAFDFTLVKFDEQFAYGDKEDVYKEVAKVTINVARMITVNVGVADFGEHENEDLAKRYGITKANFPAYRLFKGDTSSPVVYSGEVKVDALKTFIKTHTGVYIGLDGCLEVFDKLAHQFATANEMGRKYILDQMNDNASDLKNDKDSSTAVENYLKIAGRIHIHGIGFVKSEQERLRKLADGNVSDNKKVEIKRRLNVLLSFAGTETTDPKVEL